MGPDLPQFVSTTVAFYHLATFGHLYTSNSLMYIHVLVSHGSCGRESEGGGGPLYPLFISYMQAVSLVVFTLKFLNVESFLGQCVDAKSENLGAPIFTVQYTRQHYLLFWLHVH